MPARLDDEGRQHEADREGDSGEAALAEDIGDGAWAGDAAVAERLKKRLEPLAARYLIAARAAQFSEQSSTRLVLLNLRQAIAAAE